MIPGIIAGKPASGAGPTDPLWAFVTSLLNFGGADGSTTFTDSKGIVTWTPNGNVQVDTSLGYNAGLFDGSGDYLQASSDAAFGFGTGDFCVECIMVSTTPDMVSFDNRTTDEHGVMLVNQQPGSGGNNSISYYGTPGGLRSGGSGHATNDGNPHHLAWTRESGTFREFVDGVKTYEATMTSDLGTSRPGRIGGAFNNAAWFNGWIVVHRITKGVARYTADFTPPAAPFPTS